MVCNGKHDFSWNALWRRKKKSVNGKDKHSKGENVFCDHRSCTASFWSCIFELCTLLSTGFECFNWLYTFHKHSPIRNISGKRMIYGIWIVQLIQPCGQLVELHRIHIYTWKWSNNKNHRIQNKTQFSKHFVQLYGISFAIARFVWHTFRLACIFCTQFIPTLLPIVYVVLLNLMRSCMWSFFI